MQKEIMTLKEWWRKCPSKTLVFVVGLGMAVLIGIGVHELGVCFGRWIYQLLF
ncbi:MAG: hypothetical protein IJ324_00660 [Lachnospiraceae bacterium]|nr:hypothetical protein [Lachnospiraceae bacterium]